MNSDDKDRADKIKQMMMEESMDPATMAATADRMKSMQPEEMEVLIKEIDNMDAAQKEQLAAMGMDPAMMKMSMKMMQENPNIMKSAQQMMEKMTPEEMVESSRLAQEQMSKMSPSQMEEAASAMKDVNSAAVDQAVSTVRAVTASKTDSARGSAADPVLIDVMFKAAEYMSKPASGGVTFRAFATLAPIAALVGEKDSDLTLAELEECWEAGSGLKKGLAGRVDRASFEKVWVEVKELFEDDLMDEARDPNSSEARAKASLEDDDEATVGEASGQSTTVGAGGLPAMSPEQMEDMNKQFKAMTPDDLASTLDQMSKMGPEEMERVKAMGIDPAMMQKSVEIMKGNPLMMKAAQAMIGKITPEQLANAQKMAAGMSEEDLDKAMKDMSKWELEKQGLLYPHAPISGVSGLVERGTRGINRTGTKKDKFKAMSPDDLASTLDQMSKMGPEEMERVKAMGIDPAMMQKSVEIMKGNPLMMKAAQAMIGKITPEQLANAQKMAAGMSKEDLDKAMKDMSK
eukprot:CAMPEP_0171984750 /NCGR_PEP_ID=MMETSP0993-20121228/273991_1 /TAXON_ID=483369 /ORGANISM="non described non described, Strain CCMP2098" /LENGTH=516 /DNA_ID=CAMNT_0012637585 /DNA_START=188 /DNA_END=1738 /DNA_ORIENTATION=+